MNEMNLTAKIQADFDKLAHFDNDGWNHNSHYHDFLLKQIPRHVGEALEIGCGTGTFTRLLAKRANHVLALDLSPEMIRVAKERSGEYRNIDYRVRDVTKWEFPENQFDCIASITTLHHMSLDGILPKMERALKPGGTLLILDLFQSEGWRDRLRDTISVPYSFYLKLTKAGRVRLSREAREAWAEHGTTDEYLTLEQVRTACSSLRGAKITQHLLWRYSVVWTK